MKKHKNVTSLPSKLGLAPKWYPRKLEKNSIIFLEVAIKKCSIGNLVIELYDGLPIKASQVIKSIICDPVFLDFKEKVIGLSSCSFSFDHELNTFYLVDSLKLLSNFIEHSKDIFFSDLKAEWKNSGTVEKGSLIFYSKNREADTTLLGINIKDSKFDNINFIIIGNIFDQESFIILKKMEFYISKNGDCDNEIIILLSGLM